MWKLTTPASWRVMASCLGSSPVGSGRDSLDGNASSCPGLAPCHTDFRLLLEAAQTDADTPANAGAKADASTDSPFAVALAQLAGSIGDKAKSHGATWRQHAPNGSRDSR